VSEPDPSPDYEAAVVATCRLLLRLRTQTEEARTRKERLINGWARSAHLSAQAIRDRLVPHFTPEEVAVLALSRPSLRDAIERPRGNGA